MRRVQKKRICKIDAAEQIVTEPDENGFWWNVHMLATCGDKAKTATRKIRALRVKRGIKD